jgi:hypothetical protein
VSGARWHAARRASLGFAIAAVLALPRVAHAETEAERIFKNAQKAMDEKSYDAACSGFQRSYELSSGRGALYGLAQCEAARGAGLATQLRLWSQVRERFVDTPEVEREAAEKIRDLEARVARIVVEPPSSAGQVVLTIDGEPGTVGEAIPVDAGRHVVEVTIDGAAQPPVEVTVVDGERLRVPAAAAAPTAPPPQITPPPPAEESGPPWMLAGFIAAGVGLAGFTLFAVTAPTLAAASSDLDEICDAERQRCDESAAQIVADAEGLQAPNTIGLIVGLTGIAAGATFFVLAAVDDGSRSSGVDVGPGRVAWRGSF